MIEHLHRSQASATGPDGGRGRLCASVAACLVVLTVVLAACSSGGDGGDDDVAQPVAPDEIEAEEAPGSSDGSSEGADGDEGDRADEPPIPTLPPEPTLTPVSTPTPQPTRSAPEPGSGGEATGSLDEADLEIETNEGTIQIGEADVPDGVDDVFPLPEDLDVQLSSEAGEQFGFTGVTAMKLDELIAFYTEGLPGAGYEIVATQEVEGVLAVYSFEGDGVEGQVAVSEAPGGEGSSVLVTIGAGSERFSIDFGDLDLGGTDLDDE